MGGRLGLSPTTGVKGLELEMLLRTGLDWTEALLRWPGLDFDCAMSRRRRLWDRYVSLLGSVFFEEDTTAIPSSYHHTMTWVAAVDDD